MAAKKKRTTRSPRKSVRKKSPRRRARKDADPSLDKVHEILLAGERQSYEQEIAMLEKKIASGLSAIQADVRQKIAAVAGQLQDEVKAVVDRVRTLSKRVTVLSKASGEDVARLHRALSKVSSETEELHEELESKADRAALAGMLSKVAGSLNGKRR